MKRHIQTLIVVLVILLGAVFLVANPFKRGVSPESKPLFGFKKEDVTAFKIGNFVQGFAFERKDGDWTVRKTKTELAAQLEKSDNGTDLSEESEPVKADPVRVAAALTRVETAKVTQPIASSADALKSFQINEHSLHVIFLGKDGKELGRLYVGKSGPSFASSYVKRDKENDVYLVDENLQGVFLLPYDQWRYKEPASDNASLAAPDQK